MASGMKLTEKFSNRAIPVKHTLIICVPRANLILSGVVFEELTTAWGSIQDCRPLDESLNYQSEPWKWILNGLSYNPVHADSLHLIGISETWNFFFAFFVFARNRAPSSICAFDQVWLMTLRKGWLLIKGSLRCEKTRPGQSGCCFWIWLIADNPAILLDCNDNIFLPWPRGTPCLLTSSSICMG